MLVHKNEMMNKGKDLTPLGILGELVDRNPQSDILITIGRMIFKGNRVAAGKIWNS